RAVAQAIDGARVVVRLGREPDELALRPGRAGVGGALTGRRAAALPQPARGAGEPLEDRSGERMIAELERDAGGVVERIEIVREAVGELEERLDQRAAGRAPLEPRELAQGVGVRAIVGERAAERGLGGLRIAGALTRPRRHLARERAT